MKRKNYFSKVALLTLCFIHMSSPLFAAEVTNAQLNALVQQAQDKRALQENGGLATASPGDTSENKPSTLRDEAFKQLLDKISPLTPAQIIQMRKQEDKTQQAIATTPSAPPRPVSSTLTIDLSPGVTPPVVRLSAGFVSSLVFVDSTGQAWPISDYSLGNPKNFNIQWDRKTNTLFIQSATTYSSANLALRLIGLDTPVMLSLVSGQKEVDYRVDCQVQGRGPNATMPLVGDGLPTITPSLVSVLDGVPPPGSQELAVSGGYGRAWLSKGKLIFRTQLTVLSPAWSATVSSPDGTRVYEMANTPLILASQNGRTVKIELKGF
ncbi:MAG TPA: DotH/IcmK family type IV secretion protein [Gammaproteobacteria bacterium]|nr:DotH/IcmK family type IV secretion protein [Gammaproteobacteria bacterium]HQZ87637.1 DotH/IcmK family type IV secretion protein [Gammaproteobacteria bacterium]HRA42293.1 DotH/IcmK family type IV secretion protein [Gammaproteobacteria bacterium]